jgi:hypothetical protein
MNKPVLHVQINEPMSASLDRAKAAMEALQLGKVQCGAAEEIEFVAEEEAHEFGEAL